MPRGDVSEFNEFVPNTERETPPGLVVFYVLYVCFAVILALPAASYWKESKKQQHLGMQESQEDGAERAGEQEMVRMEQPPLKPSTTEVNTESPSDENGVEVGHWSDITTQQNGHNQQQTAPQVDQEIRTDHAEPAAPEAFGSSSPRSPPVNGGDSLSQAPNRNTNATPRIPTYSSSGRMAVRTRHARASRPWSHARPLGRADLVDRSLASERQSLASEEGSQGSRRSRASWASGPGHSARSRRSLSDAAGSVLEEEEIEGEAAFYRQKYVDRSKNRRRQLQRRPSNETDTSIMPPLSPDTLSPEDAVDAHDRGSRPEDHQPNHDRGIWREIIAGCDRLLVLAETDYETGRIFSISISSTIAAVADPLFRLILIGIISGTVDTESMVAFVLVNLLLRLTVEEMSGAVTDVVGRTLEGPKPCVCINIFLLTLFNYPGIKHGKGCVS
jgi:hypothetical protein